VAGKVHLDINGPIATIINDNPEKHNAFDDDMDAQLFNVLGQLTDNPEIRAIIWKGTGDSWSSGRDVGSIGVQKTELTHHQLMTRGIRGIQQIWKIQAPIICAIQGWAIGGSFQRALLCDIRIASEDAKFMLPEVSHGVIPDTGGASVLFQIAGHGLVSDMILTGKRVNAEEALQHGVISRVVPREDLDSTAQEMAEKIASAPAFTVKMARQVLSQLSQPEQAEAMENELIYQTMVNQSSDFAEFREAKMEQREPKYRRS
tara:strand:- start:292 stop:1071 length:780 start_codon:yes stop_codon:yes gene_type:complete